MTTNEHREVERKFDVGQAFALPDLSDVDGVAAVGDPVEHQLDATYFDTPDLRLARARVTLRRRRGGTDAGWHLKLPARAGARRELHLTPTRATPTPPQALLRLVEGVLRRTPVGRVAGLRTRRIVTPVLGEGGRILAELADDLVTGTLFPAQGDGAAEVLTWREVEVELVDGDEALLERLGGRLVAAGAAPSPFPSKLARVLGERLAAVDGAATGSTDTAGAVVRAAVGTQVAALQAADVMVRTEAADGIHQVRVACRRLRSILAAYRPLLCRERTDPIRDELRWLGSELSGARDREVGLAHLGDLVGTQPPELVLGPVAGRLQQAAAADARRGSEQAIRTLSDPRYFRLLETLAELVRDPPLTAAAAGPVADLGGMVAAAVRRLRRRVRAVRRTDAPEAREAALHEVRKAVRRVRYAAEVAAGPLGERQAWLVDAMTRLQDVLGARQDTVVTRELCRGLGIEAHAAGENAWTYGRLHAMEEARAAQAERDFGALWPSLHPVLRRAARKG